MKEKFVKLTKQKIEAVFDECNRLYFDNEVDKPKMFLTWTPVKKILGLSRPIVNKRTGKVSGALHISRLYNWTEENLRHVVVHEMIHLLIKDYQRPLKWWERIIPFIHYKQHDDEFIAIMNRINKTYNLDVKVRFKGMRAYAKFKL